MVRSQLPRTNEDNNSDRGPSRANLPWSGPWTRAVESQIATNAASMLHQNHAGDADAASKSAVRSSAHIRGPTTTPIDRQ